MEATLTADASIVELNNKLDKLATQIDFLTEEAYRQRRRQEEWDDLKADLTPIGNDLFRMSVEQLEEVQQYVEMEDLLRLVKRLLRNTRNLEQMLDQFESMMDLWEDVGPLTRDAFLTMMRQLNEMEQKGYFVFMQGGMDIMDKIVTSFTEEDVKQLGDNVVLILNTVKEMTQPEIMTMLSNTAHSIQDEEPVDTSMISILRQLNDPAVRKGLAKTLNVLKSVGD